MEFITIFAMAKFLDVCRKKTAKKFKLKICFEQYRSRKSIPRFPEPEAGVDTAEGGLALTGCAQNAKIAHFAKRTRSLFLSSLSSSAPPTEHFERALSRLSDGRR